MLPSDIVAKLHECATQDFIAARDSWFVWLSRSTRSVVFGLILELPELIYETVNFARNRIDRFRYRIVVLEDRLEKARLIAFLGWFLIVAGVAGEWYAGTKIDDLSARIQVCNDSKLAEVTEQAGDAQTSVKLAHDEVDAVRKEADSFKHDIVSAKQQAADAQSHLADALERTAKAEKALEELRERTRPRRILDDKRTLALALLKANTKGAVSIVCLNSDKEGCDFAKDIAGLLSEAGWLVSGPSSVVMFTSTGGPPVGLIITVKPPGPPRAGVLQNVLKRIGFTAPGQANDNSKEDEVQLTVGVKP